ncbi:phosphotransferase family protein [Microbacterium sp. ASV49]|uniref:Phosphotransferase n=1 Tax=Microbacterium candidum TaxID=3041922 RepID=A0ABT7N1Y5_9MICO|nr:phosphotransferase [Microbacterium sp. ASV49]MDL9980707.1 phosphotransferase [Microbacterium sp. ASV49]
MTPQDERRARLALVLPDGTPVGLTAAFRIDSPYEQDAAAIVDAARGALGIDVVLLRIAAWSVPDAVYTAEVADIPAIALDPVDPAFVADDPLRLTWARPGGPGEYLAWAREALADIGRPAVGDPVQVRSWNLSTLWMLPTSAGPVWLKAVPSFFAHEGALLERLSAFPVPRLIARTADAVLIAEVPGDDRYDPPIGAACRMVDLLIDIQTSVDPATLPPMPAWTPASLAPVAERTLRLAPEVAPADRDAVSTIIDGLPELQPSLDACGLSDTLVHGDFHGGNVRGDDDHLVILDWGDSGIGHPLLDVAAFTERMPPPFAARVTEHWLAAWRRAVPGSDPARALELVRPYAAVRQATLYRAFLDRIEPSEHPYHAQDPAMWLARAAELTR